MISSAYRIAPIRRDDRAIARTAGPAITIDVILISVVAADDSDVGFFAILPRGLMKALLYCSWQGLLLTNRSLRKTGDGSDRIMDRLPALCERITAPRR
jgi:hypothetical protein